VAVIAPELTPLMAKAGVVAVTGAESAEVLPAASRAETVYAYVVARARPVSANDGAVVTPIWAPSRNTVYPVTPTLSVEAVQVRLTCAGETAAATSPVGVLGGVLSTPAAVVKLLLLLIRSLPAASVDRTR
jgi:hypothetical protein